MKLVVGDGQTLIEAAPVEPDNQCNVVCVQVLQPRWDEAKCNPSGVEWINIEAAAFDWQPARVGKQMTT